MIRLSAFWTKERLEEIRTRHANGESDRQMAKAIGSTKSTIARVRLVYLRLPSQRPPAGPDPILWVPERVQKLREYRAAGWTVPQIADAFTRELGRSVSKFSVDKAIKRHKIPRRPRSYTAPDGVFRGHTDPNSEARRQAQAKVAKSRHPKALPLRQREPATLPEPRQCKWPTGYPGHPGFHWCSADRLLGRPYCAEHMAAAYIEMVSLEDAA